MQMRLIVFDKCWWRGIRYSEVHAVETVATLWCCYHDRIGPCCGNRDCLRDGTCVPEIGSPRPESSVKDERCSGANPGISTQHARRHAVHNQVKLVYAVTAHNIKGTVPVSSGNFMVKPENEQTIAIANRLSSLKKMRMFVSKLDR